MDVLLVVGMIVFCIGLGYSVGRRTCAEDLIPFIDKDSRKAILYLFKIRAFGAIRQWL